MRPSRRWLIPCLGASLMLIGSAALSGPAQASPIGRSPAITTGVTTIPASSGASGAGGQASATGASGYWTAQRMANARSGDALAPASKAQQEVTATQATGAPGAVAPAAPAHALAVHSLAGAARTSGLQPASVSASSTVGRAFFHNPANGYDYACSASALNSGSKELVLTAGHCVHGGAGGQWMTNWVFVPRYNYGAQPYGQFAAKYLTTFNAWINSSDLDRDVAMVTVWPNSHGALVNTVGGNGLSWNYSYNQFITILGYPAEAPYNGGWQQYCQGTTDRPGWWPFQENKIELHCGFTGGSSGAPWLRLYDNSTGLGYANGAMSTLNSSGWNKSSYFDDAVHNMYLSVANRV